MKRLLIIAVLISVRTTWALNPERHVTELAHRIWDSKSGVPADIRGLAQTADGYLWVGSLRGLYRFDGTLFQEFEPQSGPRLLSHEIRSVFAAPNDRLWIGYRTGGVSVLEAGRLTNYTSADGFPEGNVKGFARDPQGRIWAASSAGLASFDGKRWHAVGEESGFPGTRASVVVVDHLGALWVVGAHHIAVLPPNASRFELADEPYTGQVSQLAEAPDGTMWMAETTRAVRPLKRPGEGPAYQGMTKDECQSRFPDTWQTEPRCRRRDDLEVRVGSVAILFDHDGGFWITSVESGIRRAPYPLRLPKEPIGEFGEPLEQFTVKEGLSSDFSTIIAEDREGNIWVATRDGLDQFRNSALAPVIPGPAAAQLSIAADNDGYVAALDDNGHLFRFHDAHNRTNATKDLGFTLLYRDPFGSIWGTGRQGACQFARGECTSRMDLPGQYQQTYGSRLLAVDGNHRLWCFVPELGLFAFENGHWMRYGDASPDWTHAESTTQYTDAAGRVWFGFQDGGLLTIAADGRLHQYSSQDGLPSAEVRAVASVGTRLWVGSQAGLVLQRGPRFTPVLPYDAPAFGSVSGIVAADDGSVWLNENRGVVRISAEEVAAILLDGSHRPRYDLFGSLDGLSGASEQVTTPTAVRGTDGRLWFTTTNGAAWVDPRQLYRNELPPPVVLQSVVADGRTLSPASRLEIPGTTTHLQIMYAGLSLSVPERVQFRYRLRGLDREWQSAGTRRTADYTKLPPGSYDFEVIAANDAGVWNEVGAHVPIRIIPAWYQARWFYGLSGLLVIAILAALYRLRVAQVRADMRRLLEVRLSERERIARELHDTLLQGFQGLMFRLQAVRQLLPERPGDAESFLDSAMEAGDQAIGEGRDAVQSLRSSSVDERDLATSLSALGDELGFASPTEARPEYRVVVEGRLRELAPDIRDEAYRIVREAVRNVYQHAKATHIETELHFGDSDLWIRVRDDGMGVDPKILAQGQRPGHWGMLGMRERSERFGGSLQVWSEGNAGTEVELRIPAKVAYVLRPPFRSQKKWRGFLLAI